MNANVKSPFSKWPGILLMVAVLAVAAILSALTGMRFAIRGREVVVPELVGKTQSEAEEILEEKGLALNVLSKRFSTDIPEGRILEQIPPDGTRLKINRSVRVLLSLGDRKFPVPNLMGASSRAAQLTLAQRNLSLGTTAYAHTPEGEPDMVVHQSPKPGTSEGTDPSVNILISLGPPAEYFVMPDLIGHRLNSVVSSARSEGFQIGTINYRRYPGLEPGVVIQQQPQAGYRLSKSDVILLEVSQ